eukprot:3966777-Prorocentrum_lima.AAC.1
MAAGSRLGSCQPRSAVGSDAHRRAHQAPTPSGPRPLRGWAALPGMVSCGARRGPGRPPRAHVAVR